MRVTRIAQCALVAMCIGTGSIQAASIDQSLIDAVRDLWQSQYKALDAHDTDAVMATYADSDDIMLMGTGPGEHYVGKAEVKDAYAHFMEGFDAHTMESQCGEGAGSTEGNVVWFTAVCNFTDQQGSKARHYTTNLSAVVVKRDDALRFHTLHFSHLTGDQQGPSD